MATEPTKFTPSGEQLKQAEKEIRKEDSHVAYLKYLSNHEGITWLELADSTETGAFRVYHEKDFLSERAKNIQLQSGLKHHIEKEVALFNRTIELEAQLAAKEAEVERFRERALSGITDEEMKIASENLHFFCYTGSNMPHQHSVGCPHQKWTAEDLQSALETQMAVVRVLQHKLFGTSLDGKPQIIRQLPTEQEKAQFNPLDHEQSR